MGTFFCKFTSELVCGKNKQHPHSFYTHAHIQISPEKHTMLEAEELKAGVTNLDTGLAEVDGNDFTHVESG